MPHPTQEELAQKIIELEEKVHVGDHYVHYKSPENTYVILAIGLIEETETPCVVYKALYGEQLVWVRPESDFLAEVEFEGKTVPRFKKVS